MLIAFPLGFAFFRKPATPLAIASTPAIDGVTLSAALRAWRFPQYLTAPTSWYGPSMSSLEHYALEQKPAPAK